MSKKVVRLTESQLVKLIKNIANEKTEINEQLFGSSHRTVKRIIDNAEELNIKKTPEAMKIADKIYDSVIGLGTDNKSFFAAIYSIKNMNMLSSVADAYHFRYSETLWDAIDGDIHTEGGFSKIAKHFTSFPDA